MRVRITCSVCSYRFHLPASNVRFVEACPVCEAPASQLGAPVLPQPKPALARVLPSSASSRWLAVIEAAPRRRIQLPQPRPRRQLG